MTNDQVKLLRNLVEGKLYYHGCSCGGCANHLPGLKCLEAEGYATRDLNHVPNRKNQVWRLYLPTSKGHEYLEHETALMAIGALYDL